MDALMARLRAFVRSVRAGLFGRAARDAELDDELAAFVDQLTDRYEAQGLSPDDARRAALLATGGVTQVKEATRDAWLDRYSQAFDREMKYALRGLRRSPAFVVIAVLTLGIGVGGATAIVSVISAVLLQPLPAVARPDELFTIERVMPKGSLDDFSYADYIDFRDRSTSINGLAAYNGTSIAIDHPRAGKSRVWISYVSDNFFTVLGVRAYAGRLFDSGEVGRYSGPPVVVIGYDLWKNRFKADSSVLGSTMRIGDQVVTIIGIAPEGFVGTMRLHPMEVWIPFVAFNRITRLPDDELHDRAYTMMRTIGRRAPGATLADVRRDIGAISDHLAVTYPEDKNRGVRIFEGTGMTDGERADVKRTPRLLAIAMLLLLLIACANVAGLTLVRAAAKRRELATRLALGASRASLVRQLAIEAAIVAMLSGIVGIAIAQILTRTAVVMKTVVSVRGIEYALDWRTLGGSLTLTGVVALLVATVPAFQVSRTDIGILMKDGAGGAIRSRSRAQRLLVVGQVAASLIMLGSAAVLFAAFRRTLHIDPGFDSTGLKWVMVRTDKFDTTAQRRFVADVVLRSRSDPSLGPIALTSAAPPAPWQALSRVFRGEETPTQQALNEPGFTDGSRAYVDAISDDLFKVLRVPFVLGRDFTTEEVETTAPVAIVSRRLADELWPGQNPLGRMISWPTARGPQRAPMRVIGVVADIHHSTLAGGPSPVLYVPNTMRLRLSPLLLYRDHGGAQSSTLRTLLKSMNAEIEGDDLVATNFVDDDMARQRVVSAWSGVFGVIALLLAASGVYGVIAQSVYQRTRELAVRAAVGARPGQLLRLVLSDGVRLSAFGAIIGAIGVILSFRVFRSMFPGMEAVDLRAAAISVIVLAAATLLASFIPARRAASLNPVDALRSD